MLNTHIYRSVKEFFLYNIGSQYICFRQLVFWLSTLWTITFFEYRILHIAMYSWPSTSTRIGKKNSTFSKILPWGLLIAFPKAILIRNCFLHSLNGIARLKWLNYILEWEMFYQNLINVVVILKLSNLCIIIRFSLTNFSLGLEYFVTLLLCFVSKLICEAILPHYLNCLETM